jgi:hypothetical protein
MKIKKHEQEVSLEQMGEDLANLTKDCTQMHFTTNKTQKLDKQCWAWLHIGFISALKLYNPGFTDEITGKIVDIAQKKLE